MEAFFESPMRYWPADAAVTKLVASKKWPPRIVAIGHAPGVRGWRPGGPAAKPTFEPVEQLWELDGSRKACTAMAGEWLAVGDASVDGLVSLWDTATWKRRHTFKAGAPVTCLALSEDHLAVGTAAGEVAAWRHSAGSWEQCMPAPGKEAVRIERGGRAVRTLCLGSAGPGAGAAILVAHSASQSRVSVYRLADGQLVTALGVQVEADSAAALAEQANVVHAFMEGRMLTMVAWSPGCDPAIQVMDVVQRQAHDVPAEDRLKGRGRPLCADFQGGRLLALGCADGAVAVFGQRGWLRFHGACEVGAVCAMADRMQVATGGADGRVCLWGAEGVLMAQLRVGFPVTALAAGDVHLLAGGARGEVQAIVLLSAEEFEARGGMMPEAAQVAHAAPHPGSTTRYDPAFDARAQRPPPQDVTVAAQGLASSHPGAFEAFCGRLPAPVTAEELLAYAACGSAGDGAGCGGDSGFSSKAALAGSDTCAGGGGAAAARAGGGVDAEAQKRKQMLGEDKGVARSGAGVQLPSSTAAVGRKCDNASCLTREGLGGVVFKRCAACKSVWYCSVHCQRTDFRDRHAKECKRLAQEWQLRAAAAASGAGEGAPPTMADASPAAAAADGSRPAEACVPAAPQPRQSEPLHDFCNVQCDGVEAAAAPAADCAASAAGESILGMGASVNAAAASVMKSTDVGVTAASGPLQWRVESGTKATGQVFESNAGAGAETAGRALESGTEAGAEAAGQALASGVAAGADTAAVLLQSVDLFGVD